MKTVTLAALLFHIILAGVGSYSHGQSRRVRSSASPTPTPTPAVVRKDEGRKTSEEEVIVVQSNLVPIPASVTDRQGNTVTGLRAEDFVLTIDGQPAPIGEVSVSQGSVHLVLLFDNSSSVTVAREFEKRAAIGFLRKVIRPEIDRAALFSVSTTTRLEQDFTGDVSSLVSAVERFPSPVGLTALLDGFVGAAAHLKTVPGRRVVVVVSDGEDTGSETGFDPAVRALQMASAQVFIVKTTDYENFKRTKSREGNANIQRLTAERRMQETAKQTGGAVYSPIDDVELEAAFRQITAEISSQYLISYFPEAQSRDDAKFRSIGLRVKDRPDLTVRTRIGYYGPR